MKKIIMICDRCGKEYQSWGRDGSELYGIAEIVYDNHEPYLDSKMDLCEKCYLSLEKWMNKDYIISILENCPEGKKSKMTYEEVDL